MRSRKRVFNEKIRTFLLDPPFVCAACLDVKGVFGDSFFFFFLLSVTED